jgi:hypothetical protein
MPSFKNIVSIKTPITGVQKAQQFPQISAYMVMVK